MTPGGSARSTTAGEQLWLRSPWPLLLAICGAAAFWTFLAGDPFEGLEMRWLGQVLRWRYERGLAPPADPSIVHVDITQVDLRVTPTLELEYQSAAAPQTARRSGHGDRSQICSPVVVDLAEPPGVISFPRPRSKG